MLSYGLLHSANTALLSVYHFIKIIINLSKNAKINKIIKMQSPESKNIAYTYILSVVYFSI